MFKTKIQSPKAIILIKIKQQPQNLIKMSHVFFQCDTLSLSCDTNKKAGMWHRSYLSKYMCNSLQGIKRRREAADSLQYRPDIRCRNLIKMSAPYCAYIGCNAESQYNVHPKALKQVDMRELQIEVKSGKYIFAEEAVHMDCDYDHRE
jgi:hypothetical protein